MWVETDQGLFGPDSVTWRIMKEPVIWVAGFRAELRPGLYACPEAKQALRKSYHPDVPAEFRAARRRRDRERRAAAA